jgi:uncharacterized DUF497 family protein
MAGLRASLVFLGGAGPLRVWDTRKDQENRRKHTFADPERVLAEDLSHSASERRYYGFGWVDGGIMTVRFTYRDDVIRIFGAGYWRKGRDIYERERKIQ